MLRRFLRGSFPFSRGQWKVLIILYFFLLIFLFAPILFPPTHPVSDYSALENLIDSILEVNQKEVFSFTYFDPNTVSLDSLLAMGFSLKNSKTLIKYRSFRPFKRPEDFSKLYFVTNKLFEEIKPYLVIAPKPLNQKNYSKKRYKKAFLKSEPVYVDLNKCDTTELKKVRGIGSYLAKQILRYRSRLGGFVFKEQLLEIKFLREENYERLESQVYLSNIEIKILNVNTASWKELVRHPYINKKQAIEIVGFRKYGKVSDLSELFNQGFFSKKEWDRLYPYLGV